MQRARLVTFGIVGLAAIGGALVLRALIPPGTAAPALLPWTDAAVVARGHELYQSDCAGCHGALDGAEGHQEPSAPPHDARGHTWEHPDYALFQLTKTGEVAELCRTLNAGGNADGDAMPRFGAALSDGEIVDVLSYIKSTWPEELRAKQEAVNALYAAQNAAYRDLIHR